MTGMTFLSSLPWLQWWWSHFSCELIIIAQM